MPREGDLRSATTESTRSIPELCDDAERILDERAPHFDRHLRQILARIRRAASELRSGDGKTMSAKTYDFEVYNIGICCASVCAPNEMPVAEIAARLNAEHPTGIASAWEPSKDETFSDKRSPNPCPCNDKPETHKHYLFNC